jgi:hypothetical protein
MFPLASDGNVGAAYDEYKGSLVAPQTDTATSVERATELCHPDIS